MFGRIFETLVLAEIEEKITLHPFQVGFKRGYDTEWEFLSVEAAREQGACNRIITDYIEAYDSPRWSLLNQKLHRCGLPPMLLKIIVTYVPRDVFSAYSQWNTIEEDKIEQRSISRQSTITRAVQHLYRRSTARNTSKVCYCR